MIEEVLNPNLWPQHEHEWSNRTSETYIYITSHTHTLQEDKILK